ncbi:hypothetical protein FRB90_008493 [Tulasnella sp. 427]|nr:hypothetical protein FRB90_008493 [Tulasnella sp. 427]
MSRYPIRQDRGDRRSGYSEAGGLGGRQGKGPDEAPSRPSPVTPPIGPPTSSSKESSIFKRSSYSVSSAPNKWQLGGTRLTSPLERENRELQAQIQELRDSLSLKEREYRDQMSAKESELEELKKALCMYDECSEVDVRNIVDGINTRIQSLARNLAVRWTKEASKGLTGAETREAAGGAEVQRLREVIGTQLVTTLSDSSLGRSQFSALFLQLAWQASLVAVVHRILSSFSAILSIHRDGLAIENAFLALSGAVQRGEVQPAYGRWRLVTHQYLAEVSPKRETAVQSYANEALGLCYTAAQLGMKSFCPNPESLTKAFQDQTKDIIDQAFQLLTIIRERSVTKNYEPQILANGRTFRPEKMSLGKQDTEYAEDFVVCTVGLGLAYSYKKGRENTAELSLQILRKPQVLTGGNLNDLVAG